MNSLPLLGVYMNDSKKEKLNYSELERKDWLQYLIEAKKKVDIELYFFALDDIDFRKNIISGYYLNESTGKFEEKNFSFPHVIYKKGGVNKKNLERYNFFIKYIKENGTKFINPLKNFNKWEIHQHLQKYPDIKEYLVKTNLFECEIAVQKMLDKWGSLYLKSTKGRCGKDIVRINQQREGYESIFYRKEPKKIPAKDFEELMRDIYKFFGGKDFVIQEAIDLVTVDDKLIDMRAELQRNGKDEVEIVAIPVRVGMKDSPITQHSESYQFEEFFDTALKWPRKNISNLNKLLEKVLPRIYKRVEKLYGKCGEMGIDIGLDKNHQIKFIECNSQPTRISLKNAYGPFKVEEVYEKLLNYARNLASSPAL